MKIGIYTGTIPPPVFIENLMNGLAEKGDKVFVYGKPTGRNYQFLSSGITQRKFPATKIGVLLNPIYLFLMLFISQPHLGLTLGKQVWQNSKSWIQFLHRLCRILPPLLDNLDILHIQWAKTLVYYPEFIEQLECPVVLSVRGAHINYSPLADKQLAQGYLKYFPLVSGFHAVSEDIAKEAEKYAADPGKITVIHPAVKCDLMNDVLSIKTNDPTKILKIISVGRCHWKKGYTIALDAMAILKTEGVSFHYTIIAGGNDHENIQYQIHDLGLIKCVSFINGLPHDKVIEKLLKSDIFLLPSVEEGIANSVLEAMALGVPVISTDCGGMAEVIINGKNGFLVPVRDPDSMGEAVQHFLCMNEARRMIIIDNARETIIHHHQLNDQIDKFSSLYNHIIQTQ